ncbi:hypothetical protein AIDNDMCJ_00720 [Bacillus safensis]|nr:hypothetical protein AIDNDMCJ_00720 [Bacillus safensis]
MKVLYNDDFIEKRVLMWKVETEAINLKNIEKSSYHYKIKKKQKKSKSVQLNQRLATM